MATPVASREAAPLFCTASGILLCLVLSLVRLDGVPDLVQHSAKARSTRTGTRIRLMYQIWNWKWNGKTVLELVQHSEGVLDLDMLFALFFNLL